MGMFYNRQLVPESRDAHAGAVEDSVINTRQLIRAKNTFTKLRDSLAQAFARPAFVPAFA